MGECKEREELSPFPEYKLKASCNHIAGMQSVYTVKHSLSPGSTSLSQHCTQRSLCSVCSWKAMLSHSPQPPVPYCALALVLFLSFSSLISPLSLYLFLSFTACLWPPALSRSLCLCSSVEVEFGPLNWWIARGCRGSVPVLPRKRTPKLFHNNHAVPRAGHRLSINKSTVPPTL